MKTVQKRAEHGAGNVSNGSSDESIVDALIRLYPRIRARALFLTQEAHAADDLVQQLCERVLRAQASFTPGTDAAAWMHRVLRNLFIDSHRSRRATVELLDEPAASTYEQPGPCDFLTLKDIRQAMRAIRPHERELLHLAHFEHLSYREIAARLSLSETTIGTRLFRARARLKRPLELVFERKLASFRG